LTIKSNLIFRPIKWIYQFLISNSSNIDKEYIYLKNINSLDNFTIEINDTSNSFAFNFTSICNNFSNDISLNSGNFSVLFRALGECYIINEYNFSIGKAGT